MTARQLQQYQRPRVGPGEDQAGATEDQPPAAETLVDRLPKGFRPLGRVRGVHAVGRSVCFRTDARLFLWDGGTMRVVPAPPFQPSELPPLANIVPATVFAMWSQIA